MYTAIPASYKRKDARSEDRYLRIKTQLIVAQPYQDWHWNFDIFQLEVQS